MDAPNYSIVSASRSRAFLSADEKRGRTSGYVETAWGVVGVMLFDMDAGPSVLYLSVVAVGRAFRVEMQIPASASTRVVVREANAFARNIAVRNLA